MAMHKHDLEALRARVAQLETDNAELRKRARARENAIDCLEQSAWGSATAHIKAALRRGWYSVGDIYRSEASAYLGGLFFLRATPGATADAVGEQYDVDELLCAAAWANGERDFFGERPTAAARAVMPPVAVTAAGGWHCAACGGAIHASATDCPRLATAQAGSERGDR